MPTCLIPGCTNNAENNISIRCRRTDTSAIWAPNTEAYLCDIHAALRAVVERTVTTNVSAGGRTETRTTPIIHHP
jgi:hypothetical protein